MEEAKEVVEEVVENVGDTTGEADEVVEVEEGATKEVIEEGVTEE